MIKIIIFVVLIAMGIFTYAMCMAAATSDEEAERKYQEYLEYKRKKEAEKWKD